MKGNISTSYTHVILIDSRITSNSKTFLYLISFLKCFFDFLSTTLKYTITETINASPQKHHNPIHAVEANTYSNLYFFVNFVTYTSNLTTNGKLQNCGKYMPLVSKIDTRKESKS